MNFFKNIFSPEKPREVAIGKSVPEGEVKNYQKMLENALESESEIIVEKFREVEGDIKLPEGEENLYKVKWGKLQEIKNGMELAEAA